MRVSETQFDRLMNAAGRRMKCSLLLAGLCRSLAICLGMWLLLFAADNLLSLPAGLRLPLTLVGVAISGVLLYRRVLRPMLRRQTPERTAVMLEARYGVRENLLINAVQFQTQPLKPEERAFAEQTLVASEAIATRVKAGELWDWPKLRGWAVAALVVLGVWALFIACLPRQFGVTAARYALPLSDVPPAGDRTLKLTPGGDVTVAEGDSLEVGLELQKSAGPPLAKPPLIAWQETVDSAPLSSTGCQTADMTPPAAAGEPQADVEAGAEGARKFSHTFANIRVPFAFRVFAGDGYTRGIAVKVLPMPSLQHSTFRITPPGYTGLKTFTSSGPPGLLSVLAGSQVAISFELRPAVKLASWNLAETTKALDGNGSHWETTILATNPGAYVIKAAYESGGQPLVIARGDVQIIPDSPPEVDFVTEDRNRLVQFGQTLTLQLRARDDYGVREIAVTARPIEKEDAAKVVKRWTYLGPPGNPGPLRETLSLVIDPGWFESGVSYYLEAQASDFRPNGTSSHSRPIVLRVKSAEDMTLRDDDPLKSAFDLLKQTAASQEKANRQTANLETYLDEVLRKHQLEAQARALREPQDEARQRGAAAVGAFRQQADGKTFATTLATLVDHDMAGVRNDLESLSTDKSKLTASLAGVATRQEQILTGLLALLGRVADAREDRTKPLADGKDQPQPPATGEEAARQWLEDVKNFVGDQERILEKSRTLADKGPEDLTQGGQDALGEMSREEGKWAKFFQEKLTDFSKLPQQDFGDASMAQEFNSVYQEVQLAADALTQKKITLAVPFEQSGLENAQQLVNNLERWLPDAPDNIKWSMEEPLTPADIALAELPKELEDIVGELLDHEEQMTPEVEDVTSSWMDSADKGAGWGAGDGPISDMSAKGVTGNLLPNKNEVGGRSGEGRTGRSHGQMVSDTAEGKGGRETPTRLTPEPFEQGSVKDSAKSDEGGATGGGKLSGAAGEGLRGPAPPSSDQRMPRLSEQQARIRQQAEALALKLRRYHISTGELETSVNAMEKVEQAAQKGEGLAVRRAFNQAVSTLGQAKEVVNSQATVRHEQSKLPTWVRDQLLAGAEDGVPKGYEEMVAEYYRALAEGRTK